MSADSLQFLAFGVIAACLYNLFRPVTWRQGILLVANLSFLSTFTSSPRAFLPFTAFLLLGYVGVRAMQSPATRPAFVPLLIAIVAVFVWLKKYTFLPAGTFLRFSYVTIGFSYILFRVLHMMIDARADELRKKIGVISYLNHTLNFMTLVSGPIQRYENFAETQLAPVRTPLTIFLIGEGLHRIVLGFFKVTVVSWLLSMLQKQAIAALFANPLWGSKVITGAIIAGSYPLFLYFNFSGYTDIVIGMGRFFRFALPENFNRPLSAANYMDFWNRWHITLSNWLKTYVFNPLLLTSMRRIPSPSLEPFLAVPAFFITFSLVGIWHGQTTEFLFFGFLQGLGVAGNQLYQSLQRNRLGHERYRALASNGVYVALSRGLTFTYLTFSLFWFWSSWKNIGDMVAGLGWSSILQVVVTVFFVSTVVLSVFEMIRNRALSIRWNGSPLLLSRYALTVFDTCLLVAAAVVVILLNAPPPDIVYKAF